MTRVQFIGIISAKLKNIYWGEGWNIILPLILWTMVSTIRIIPKSSLLLYADFKDAYPKSNYTPLITQAIESIIAFRKQLAKDSLNPNVKLVTDFQDIDTLEDLFSSFKGKKTLCGHLGHMVRSV